MAGGIEASIASLSMNMARGNLATQVSTKMLSKVMETSEQAAMQMVNTISEIPVPGINEIGGLLNIRA